MATSAHNAATDINASPIARLLTTNTGPPRVIAIAVPLVPRRAQRSELHHSLMFNAQRDLSRAGVFHFGAAPGTENRERGYECAGRAAVACAPAVRAGAGMNARKRTPVRPVVVG
jgi:hypothetical protein